MIRDLITDKTFLEHVRCKSWEDLVDVSGGLLVRDGSVEPRFIRSIKETIEEYGAYMVLVDDIAFFHGRPDAGVIRTSMSLTILDEPVYLEGRRIKAAFVFAAMNKSGHLELMRELGGFLQDEDFLELLRNSGSKEEIMKRIEEGATME